MKEYCSLAGICGGCFYTKETPEEELLKKGEQVRSLLSESHEEPFLFEGILQSPLVKGYRNKMEYTFGDQVKDGDMTLGMHQKGSFISVV